MARTTWSTYIQESDLTWTLTYALPVPNEDLEINVSSNQIKQKLADGSNAFMTPETTYERLPLTFRWYGMDEAFRAQIQSWIENQDYLKIITSEAGREFIGRFIALKATWLTGQFPHEYDVEAEFELMDAVGGVVMSAQDVLDLFVFQETPTPVTDGVQTVFTTGHTYQPGSLKVYRNGVLLYEGIDYTETTASTFTLTIAPESTELLRVDYIKA